MAELRPDAVVGQWVHSHEEDTSEEMVYRPPSYGFPRSRGRTSLDLRPDGTYVESSPGPVDVPVESEGTWSIEGGRLFLEGAADRPGQAWEVAAAERDRLTLRR